MCGVLRGVAQSGSARALGAWGRRFKSSHPDQCGPVVKRSKTPPFHGGNMGSIPVRVTKQYYNNITTTLQKYDIFQKVLTKSSL